MSDERVTYGDLFRPESELGDQPLEVSMTVRQMAAVSFVFGRYMDSGAFEHNYARLLSEDEAAARGWLIAFGEVNARFGRMMTRLDGSNVDFSGHLARLDQEKAEWRDGE